MGDCTAPLWPKRSASGLASRLMLAALMGLVMSTAGAAQTVNASSNIPAKAGPEQEPSGPSPASLPAPKPDPSKPDPSKPAQSEHVQSEQAPSEQAPSKPASASATPQASPSLTPDPAVLGAVIAPTVSTQPPFTAAFQSLGAPLPERSPVPGAVDLNTVEPARGPRIVESLGLRVASYYGKRFHGRLTANGERFDMNAMTAAHKTLPFGTRVRVTDPVTGRSVTVRINDRGPFIKGREIDLSRGAAQRIGMIQRGHARVRLEIVAP